ncbi:hypothetical protein DFJ73DRAFT_955671 [Zopfochytrium polystomum]|nr:hypothetical protein DFJ73DRAFT_955671 [Zopfochytrium polystomum]
MLATHLFLFALPKVSPRFPLLLRHHLRSQLTLLRRASFASSRAVAPPPRPLAASPATRPARPQDPRTNSPAAAARAAHQSLRPASRVPQPLPPPPSLPPTLQHPATPDTKAAARPPAPTRPTARNNRHGHGTFPATLSRDGTLVSVSVAAATGTPATAALPERRVPAGTPGAAKEWKSKMQNYGASLTAVPGARNSLHKFDPPPLRDVAASKSGPTVAMVARKAQSAGLVESNGLVTEVEEALAMKKATLMAEVKNVVQNLPLYRISQAAETHVVKSDQEFDVFFAKLLSDLGKRPPGTAVAVDERGSRSNSCLWRRCSCALEVFLLFSKLNTSVYPHYASSRDSCATQTSQKRAAPSPTTSGAPSATLASYLRRDGRFTPPLSTVIPASIQHDLTQPGATRTKPQLSHFRRLLNIDELGHKCKRARIATRAQVPLKRAVADVLGRCLPKASEDPVVVVIASQQASFDSARRFRMWDCDVLTPAQVSYALKDVHAAWHVWEKLQREETARSTRRAGAAPADVRAAWHAWDALDRVEEENATPAAAAAVPALPTGAMTAPVAAATDPSVRTARAVDAEAATSSKAAAPPVKSSHPTTVGGGQQQQQKQQQQQRRQQHQDEEPRFREEEAAEDLGVAMPAPTPRLSRGRMETARRPPPQPPSSAGRPVVPGDRREDAGAGKKKNRTTGEKKKKWVTVVFWRGKAAAAGAGKNGCSRAAAAAPAAETSAKAGVAARGAGEAAAAAAHPAVELAVGKRLTPAMVERVKRVAGAAASVAARKVIPL